MNSCLILCHYFFIFSRKIKGIWADDDEEENYSKSKKDLKFVSEKDRSGKRHNRQINESSFPSIDSFQNEKFENQQIGKWEDHTKGIGMKLLQKVIIE